MIIPNVVCQVQTSKSRDEYGQDKLEKPKQEYCNVVRLVSSSEKTSVRADSSASRGAGEELTSTSRLLFLPLISISVGDKIEIAGLTLRVKSIHPRFDVRGTHDHNQVDLTAWA